MLLVRVVARQRTVRLVVDGEVGKLGRVKNSLGLGIVEGLIDPFAAELAGDVNHGSGCRIGVGKIHVIVVGLHVGPAHRRVDQTGGIGPRILVVADAEPMLIFEETIPVHRIDRSPLADGGAAVVESGVVVGDLVDDVARAVASGVSRAGNARGHGLRGAIVRVGIGVERIHHAHGDLLTVQVAAGHSGRRAIAEDEHCPDRLGDGACGGLGEPGTRGVGLIHLGRVLSGEGLTEEGPAVGGRGIEIHRERGILDGQIAIVGVRGGGE